MPVNTAYLALGSNMGQRLEQMRASLRLLDEKRVTATAASPIYENRAMGIGEADPFLNAVVKVQTELKSESLLETCLVVEAQLGRVRSKIQSSRTIDIDLLTYGTLHMETDKLHLPHPRITERDFVLQPFNDIAPDFKLHGKPIHSWLLELPTVKLTRIADKLI